MNERIKEGIWQVFAWLVILATVYCFYVNYNIALSSAKSMRPSVYTHQWQKAMYWVRDNTPKDAVFGHWWDYGYWVQSIGERATMLDGGNAIGYWNYLMGRHVLTGESEEEAMEVLYNHDVTYFLIDSTEIGKYGAYSNIGSDENYDRFSQIGTFVKDDSLSQETNSGINHIYRGGVLLDEDLITSLNGQEVFLPAQQSGVGAISVGYDSLKEDYVQPKIIGVYQGKQYNINLRYLFIEGELKDFGSGYEGCAYVFPKISQNQMDKTGVAMFLSERNMRALWVRLYLLGMGENFELVHSEQSLIIEDLRNQGVDVPEIIYHTQAGGILGPIKIWKINYIGNEKINEEYTRTTFPEEIAKRNLV